MKRKYEKRNTGTLSKMEKIQVFRSAVDYVATQGVSVREAAKKFNICASTLSTRIKSGEDYKGRGRISKHFTAEEEEVINEKALELVENGQTFTINTLKRIIEDVLSV